MIQRKAHAIWEGPLNKGQGTISLGSGAIQLPYSFDTRFKDKNGSNPEELIGGAHAGCFSMALAKELADAGFTPKQIETTAKVSLQKGEQGFTISEVRLETSADVPDLDDSQFQRLAENAKRNCPVSKLLATVKISLRADLLANQQV